MKKIYTLALILISSIASFCQSPSWQWAQKAAGTGDDRSNSIVTDASGNVYITGYFASTTLTFGAVTLNNAGGDDIFIAKYDPSGNVLWAKDIGGSLNERANSIAIDNSGNIYIAGFFVSASLTFGTITLTNIDPVDIFYAKYTSAGNVVWAKKAGALGGGANNVNCTSITTDATGHFYMTGWFNGFINFDGTNINNTNPATYDGFYAKYDTSGSPQILTHFGGTGDDFGYSIVADNSGNTFLSGSFASANLYFGTSALTNAGGYDAFILKYNSTANEEWARSASGTGSEEAYSVTTDTAGNAYITGYFASLTLNFGGGFISNAGVRNIFVAKYTTAGLGVWAERFGGTGYDYGQSITRDASGKLLLTGATSSSTILFGATTLTNATSGGGPYDIFVTELETQAGSAQWARGAGGTDYDEAAGVAGDVNGNTYVTGLFGSSPCVFGTQSILWTGAASTYDVFVAKLNSVTGINDASSSLSMTISIYPNPVSSELTVRSSENINEINILDVLGKQVYKAKISEPVTNLKLQTSNFPDGIYFLKIISGENVVSKKVVIQK